VIIISCSLSIILDGRRERERQRVEVEENTIDLLGITEPD
jgi:hypothetical protein